MKKSILFSIMICCILFGQKKDSWTNKLHPVERTAAIDTLSGLNHESSGRVFISPRKRFVRWVAAYGTILLGGLAWKIQMESDRYYDQYLHAGDLDERQEAWDQTKKLDQASGMMVVGSQLFMQLLIYSYIEDN